MLSVVRVLGSLAILLWGLVMILLGFAQGVLLWVAIGIAVVLVGIPLLGSHPWATGLLYPRRGQRRA